VVVHNCNTTWFKPRYDGAAPPPPRLDTVHAVVPSTALQLQKQLQQQLQLPYGDCSEAVSQAVLACRDAADERDLLAVLQPLHPCLWAPALTLAFVWPSVVVEGQDEQAGAEQVHAEQAAHEVAHNQTAAHA
jgi:hypothetical protein